MRCRAFQEIVAPILLQFWHIWTHVRSSRRLVQARSEQRRAWRSIGRRNLCDAPQKHLCENSLNASPDQQQLPSPVLSSVPVCTHFRKAKCTYTSGYLMCFSEAVGTRELRAHSGVKHQNSKPMKFSSVVFFPSDPSSLAHVLVICS